MTLNTIIHTHIPEAFGEGKVTIDNRHIPDGGQKLQHNNGRANKIHKKALAL